MYQKKSEGEWFSEGVEKRLNGLGFYRGNCGFGRGQYVNADTNILVYAERDYPCFQVAGSFSIAKAKQGKAWLKKAIALSDKVFKICIDDYYEVKESED